MHPNNGNGPAIDLTQSIAGLERGIGLLWNKVDEFQAATKENAITVNQKLETWITTNYSIQESTQSLLQAIVALMNEIRVSAEYSEKGNQFLAQFSEQLPQLQAAVGSISGISKSLSEISIPSNEPEAIESQMEELGEQLSKQLSKMAIDLKRELVSEIEKLEPVESQSIIAANRPIQIPDGMMNRWEKMENCVGSISYVVNHLSRVVTLNSQLAEDADEPGTKTLNYRVRKRLRKMAFLVRKHPWSSLGSVAAAGLVLAIAVHQGQSQVISQLGGQDNFETWQQIQELNQQRLSECQKDIKEECNLRIPPHPMSLFLEKPSQQ